MKTFLLIIVLISLTGFDQSDLIHCEACLTEEEKKLYDLIMEYRKSKKFRRNSTFREPDPGGPDTCQGSFGKLQIRSKQ